jgi:hypothetical protein
MPIAPWVCSRGTLGSIPTSSRDGLLDGCDGGALRRRGPHSECTAWRLNQAHRPRYGARHDPGCAQACDGAVLHNQGAWCWHRGWASPPSGTVKQSGGFIAIYSTLGKGTTVHLYFPKAEPGPSVRPANPFAKEAPMGGGELILIIEDDDKVREATVCRLESLGYAVRQARTGPEAIRLLSRIVAVSVPVPVLVLRWRHNETCGGGSSAPGVDAKREASLRGALARYALCLNANQSYQVLSTSCYHLFFVPGCLTELTLWQSQVGGLICVKR